MFQIIAHRGYSSLYPDNSMAAFEAALKAGADAIETDIREDDLGRLVCAHDAGATDAVLFLQLLHFAKGKIALLLDLKQDGLEFSKKVCDVLTQQKMEDQIIIGVRSVAHAQAIRDLMPGIPILGFLSNPAEFAALSSMGGTISRLWEGDVTPQTMAQARSGNAPVWIMSGFYPRQPDGYGDITEDRLKTLVNMGIQGVLVNDPALARRVRGDI